MKYNHLKVLIKSDLSRLSPPSKWNCLKRLLFNASFKITFWYRVCGYFKSKKSLFFKFIYHISYIIYKHNQYLTGIQLPVTTQIGKGLTFAHFSNIVIASTAIMGDNIIIYNGVTVGTVHGHKGAPTIGNNVVLYTGCKVLGNITIGSNVVIGANAVVTKDIPDYSVAVGIPAKVISDKGREYFSLITNRID